MKFDLHIGVALATLMATSISLISGVEGVLYFIWLYFLMLLIPKLWDSESNIANTIALLLLPALLFRYFLPIRVKETIQAIRDENATK